MFPGRHTVFMAAILILTLGGCRTGRDIATRENPFRGGGGRDQVTIYVTNLAFADATLFAVTTGSRRKLGTVIGKQEGVFTLPMPFPTDLYVEIDLLAGPKCFTENLPVDPGDEFDLVIQIDGANFRCGGLPLTSA